jgi:hypothetical protein
MKKEPKEIIKLWVDAFNQANPSLLADFYAEEAVNHQVANEPILGKDAIKSMFEKEFAMANMVCIIENIFQDGNWGMLEWKDPLGLRGCGFFQFNEDGKIIFQRGYWDKLKFLKIHNLPIE